MASLYYRYEQTVFLARRSARKMREFFAHPNLVWGAWVAFLILLPVGTRALIGHVTKGFHEYESMFIYASDLAVLLLILISFLLHIHRPGEWHARTLKILLVPLGAVLVFAALSVALAPSFALGFYGFMRLLFFILFAWWVVPMIVHSEKAIQKTAIVIALLAVAQAVIGVLQFLAQRSLGLAVLGESVLDPVLGLGSKVPFGGGLLRAYGTFVHPNILGAFLLLGLFAMLYGYLLFDWKLYRYDKKKSVGENFSAFVGSRYFYLRLITAVGVFLVLLGLALTFSRGAWISGLAGLAVITAMLFRRGHFRAVFRMLAMLFVAGLAVYLILQPILNERFIFTPDEPAVAYRVAYNKMGLAMMNERPLGVGMSNQVLFAVREGMYQDVGMRRVWEWEPIHNLYLLMGVEIGVGGLLGFVVFTVCLLWMLLRRRLPLVKLFVVGSLVAILAFGLFDHFLWTIQAGRLMLWTVIGMAIALLVTPQGVGSRE